MVNNQSYKLDYTKVWDSTSVSTIDTSGFTYIDLKKWYEDNQISISTPNYPNLGTKIIDDLGFERLYGDTGRTTRMIKSAMDMAIEGKTVSIVIDPHVLSLIVEDLYNNYYYKRITGYRFEGDDLLLRTMGVDRTIKVFKGIEESGYTIRDHKPPYGVDHVFVDHNVVYKTFKPYIDEYIRWNSPAANEFLKFATDLMKIIMTGIYGGGNIADDLLELCSELARLGGYDSSIDLDTLESSYEEITGEKCEEN